MLPLNMRRFAQKVSQHSPEQEHLQTRYKLTASPVSPLPVPQLKTRVIIHGSERRPMQGATSEHKHTSLVEHPGVVTTL